MEATALAAESGLEACHWWFVGRRRLFTRMLRQARLPTTARILDAGTGTGANLRLLRDLRYPHAEGIDRSPEAIRFCAAKGLGPVSQADLTRLPFADGYFDLVLLTDVLEHLDDDMQGLREVGRVLRPGGAALVTVPAFPALWGRQDVVSHHRRRYRPGELESRVAQAGLPCQDSFYFNYLLFAPIWAARQLLSRSPLALHSENELTTGWLNRLLSAIFAVDVFTAPYLRPPVGVSLLAWCVKLANPNRTFQ